MKTETVAKKLYDNHLDFDVISEDILDGLTVEDGKIRALEETYDYLVVPYAPEMPETLMERLRALEDRGGKVLFVSDAPAGYGKAETVRLDLLAEWLRKQGVGDIQVTGAPYLRHYHAVRDGNDVFMFFNEDISQTFDGEIELPVKGDCTVLDILGDDAYTTRCDGKLRLTLTPYQSAIVVFNADETARKTPLLEGLTSTEFTGEFEVSVAEYTDIHNFKFCFSNSSCIN